jgi:phospholipase/carboxylesterase
VSAVESWPHVWIDGDQDTPLALLLHGTGADEHDLIPLGKALLPGSPILSPRGRVSEGGMNRWFARMGEGIFDVDDVIFRAGQLAEFLRDAKAHYGLGDRPVVAVGFSNGANIGSALALLHPTAVRAVAAFSGMYPFGDRDPVVDATGVALFLANGTDDPMAPLPSVTKLDEVASSHGAHVTRSVRPGGHGLGESDLAAAATWLASLSLTEV